MRRSPTLREKVEARIAQKPSDVFLTREFRDLGGEDQVGRVLRELVRARRLVRLGYGVYGPAVVSQLSGEPLLANPGGFLGAARQALDKLGVAWEPTEWERAYNEGLPGVPGLGQRHRRVRRYWGTVLDRPFG